MNPMNEAKLKEARMMARIIRLDTRLPHDFPFDLIDWLVDRAKLAKKLQDAEYSLSESYRQEQQYVLKLEKQNKRYHEALKFYADSENYRHKLSGLIEGWQSTTMTDTGNKARRALEDESE